MRNIDRITVHCSATPPSMDIGAAEIRLWHTSPPRNWADIGYHFVIRRKPKVPGDRLIEVGRPVEFPGAHAVGYNESSIGICLVGGVNEHDRSRAEANFTMGQYEALLWLIDQLVGQYPGIEHIGGHRDLSPDRNGDGRIEPDEWLKDCPGFDVAALLDGRYS